MQIVDTRRIETEDARTHGPAPLLSQPMRGIKLPPTSTLPDAAPALQGTAEGSGDTCSSLLWVQEKRVRLWFASYVSVASSRSARAPIRPPTSCARLIRRRA